MPKATHPKPFYDKFICHHKADAAAQARFLQVCLQAHVIMNDLTQSMYIYTYTYIYIYI